MKKIKPIVLLFIVVIILALGFYPMESYISRPGGAYELSPLVHVENGDEDDEGTFSLLTIALAKATPLTYAYAKVADNHKIYQANQVRREDEDEEEYEDQEEAKEQQNRSKFQRFYHLLQCFRNRSAGK